MRLLMASGDRQVAVGEQGPFFSMLREFSRHFERIDVLGPRPPKPVTTRRVFDNVHLWPADCGRAGMVGYVARKGAELATEHGSRLVVSHDYGWFYNGFGAARIRAATGVPYLSEIHHVPGHPRAADLRERFDKQVARRYVAWARKRAAAFRVVNHAEMPALLRSWGVPDDRIRVIPSLYIDLDVFRPAPDTEPEYDVLYVGRMVNNKGLDRIVDALAGLRARGRDARALFVGRGPFADATRRRVARRGLADRAQFIEWVDSAQDLADLYRKSRVAVCASTCEGGPRVTVEAMACGTPVVSTPVGVMTELLEDGTCGRLCGFDAQSLEAALSDVLADEERRRRLGRAAHERVQRFEYHRTIQFYADSLKDLVAEVARAS